MKAKIKIRSTMSLEDPDLKLRRGEGGWLFFLLSFVLFSPKIRGDPGQAGPLPRSATTQNFTER